MTRHAQRYSDEASKRAMKLRRDLAARVGEDPQNGFEYELAAAREMAKEIAALELVANIAQKVADE